MSDGRRMDRRDARVDLRIADAALLFDASIDGLAGADASASGTEALASRAH